MTGPLRSKQGCWTCRLRKKKCDEGRPHCSTCDSLSITCYGYGPKPDWMNNGDEERAILDSFKQTVKYTSRKRTTKVTSKPHDQTIRIAPKSASPSKQHPSSDIGVSPQNGNTPSSENTSTEESAILTPQDGSTGPPSPKAADHVVASSTNLLSADDSALLMHFLDNVFPLQFCMYKPGVTEGGRGWLLSLLLRSEPYQHAALALSAYHHRSVVRTKTSHSYQNAALITQEAHLEACIKMVHQSAQNGCPNLRLSVLASVVQLVFYELFAGSGGLWHNHLRAAINMYQTKCVKNLPPFDMAQDSTTDLSEDHTFLEHGHGTMEALASLKFISGTIIWLDIISCVTSGHTPQLMPFHTALLAPQPQISLEAIMGCRNWVMLQMSRISALHELKTKAMQQQHSGCTEIERIHTDISQDIHCGLARLALEGFNLSEHTAAATSDSTSDSATTVTHIFAFMATIYLHLVMEGFHNLQVLETNMAEAIELIRSRLPPQLLPALVLPLFVIGSVAGPGDEQFFQDVFSSPMLLNPVLKSRATILPVLEDIWSKRRTTLVMTWGHCLELTNGMLLI